MVPLCVAAPIFSCYSAALGVNILQFVSIVEEFQRIKWGTAQAKEKVLDNFWISHGLKIP